MRVFYSWQSDTPSSLNRSLIEKAARNAIEAVAAEADVEPAERMELDQDTRGVLGAPGIAETILRKISDSGVVLADVTLTGTAVDDEKQINSNVAIELGYAIAKLTDERLVAVMNEHFGGPEELPFDLRHRRWPIRYNLGPDADDVEKRRQTEHLTRQLKSVLEQYVGAEQIAQDEYRPQPSTTNPATFWDLDETLVAENPERGWSALTCRGARLIYLRIWPDRVLPTLSTADASQKVWESHIGPLSHRTPEGWSDSHNRYGGITYSADRDQGLILSGTQLFPTRELWGFDSYIMNDRGAAKRDGEPSNYIPWGLIEQTFTAALNRYLRFAWDTLDYATPIYIEAGISNVRGCKIVIERRYEEGVRGEIFEDHICSRVSIERDTDQAVSAALLTIFSELFAFSGTHRPPNLYNFPSPDVG